MWGDGYGRVNRWKSILKVTNKRYKMVDPVTYIDLG